MAVEHFKGNDTFYIKEKWEKEANMLFSVDEWEESSEQQWKTSYPGEDRDRKIKLFFFMIKTEDVGDHA